MATTSEPRTLRAAHEVASNRRPDAEANPVVWLAFHRANARMYQTISDVDRWHHHEALYWADYERRKVAEVTAEIQNAKSKTE